MAGCSNNCCCAAADDRGSQENGIANLFLHRNRLSRQSRLLHMKVFAFDDAGIGWNEIAWSHTDPIVRHDFGAGNFSPVSIAKYGRGWSHAFAQALYGAP